MRFNVAGLLKSQTGETREAELDAPVALAEPELRVLAPVRGHLRFIRDDAGVLVEGRLATTIAMDCARCLAPVSVELEFELSESFRPTVFLPGGPPLEPAAERDEATEIDALHELDLSEVVRQAVLLAAPLHPLCRENCAGLCPRCGQDWNMGPCACEPEPDPRWGALHTLMQDS